MKKLILSVTALATCSLGAYAQGVIAFDASSNTSASPTATSNGQTFINGVLDTSTDINAELLYSSTAGGTFSPVVTLLLSSTATAPTTAIGTILSAAGDVSFLGIGPFDNSGSSFVIPTIPSSTTAYFEVEGWLGQSSTYAGATGAKGITPVFSEVLSTVNPPIANLSNMPALNLTTAVPEPSTLAMAGVGLASMLIFRRKNK